MDSGRLGAQAGDGDSCWALGSRRRGTRDNGLVGTGGNGVANSGAGVRLSAADAERIRRRYPRSRVPRPMLVSAIGLCALAALGWLVWAATVHSLPQVAAQVAGYRVTSDTEIAVTLTVDRRDPSQPVVCRVLAQAEDFQPVGERLVAVAGSDERVVDVPVRLTTIRRAATAVVKDCAVG